MAGFLLGTGSGLLAGAAVYYTLSTQLAATTDILRADLHNSSRLLEQSFNPSAVPAPSSLVGPSYPSHPGLGELMKRKWNATVASTLHGARETDWLALGAGAVRGARDVAGRIGQAAERAMEAAPGDTGAAEAQGLVEGVANPAAEDLERELVLEGRMKPYVPRTWHVDRPAQRGEEAGSVPKRLV